MRSLSLKWKIVLAGIVPLVFFIAVSAYQIARSYQHMHAAEVAHEEVLFIEAVSATVHETQFERGKTASFLGGGVNLGELEVQRNINNEKIDKMRSLISATPFTEDYKKKIVSTLNKIDPLRNRINSKSISAPQALKAYTGIIKSLLDIELHIADITTLPSVASKVRGLRVLEDAKEAGGKLRANLTSILSKNVPINDDKLSTLINLKSGVVTNLDSSSLVLDKKATNYIQKFKKSREWKKTEKVFNTILHKAETGDYGYDAGKFFAVISTALGILNKLVLHEEHYIDDLTLKIKDEASSRVKLYSTVLAVLLAAISFFIFYVVRISSESIEIIKKIGENVAAEADDVAKSSESISSISYQLSETSTEQASGLQETVSSIDEISSMVQKNADAANSSTQISAKSNEVATKGKEIVETMVSSMNDISSSNDQIMDEVLKNNDEISKIVQVISEIGEKTKVINDIVFQTKLLSFNASVEAARAGEHGKGFAVVAEEVGNLASMSGKAALEITEMLESSTKQVTHIVESAKSKVESLMKSGKEKVDTGIHTANQCGESLDEILENVSSVNEMIREIASASSEQASGVQEITKAMQQLDAVTHQNSSLAQESSSTAGMLKEKAASLNKAISQMMTVVNGGEVSDDWQKKGPTSHATTKEEGVDNNKVLSMPQKSTRNESSSHQSEQLKVSGLDTTIPSDSDPRFEDL